MYGKVSQQMTERGIEALVSGEIVDIISDTNRKNIGIHLLILVIFLLQQRMNAGAL